MSSKNLKEQYDVIIIGNGIASKVFLFSFLKRFSDRRVLVIESPLYPACSIKTTSHVAVAQAVEGSGPLGQLVVDSYLAFRQFFEIYSPKGVEKGHLFQDEFKDGVDHFFITPSTLYSWFDEKTSGAGVNFCNDHVLSVEEFAEGVQLHSKETSYITKKVLLAPGAGFNGITINGVDQDFYRGFVRRPGSYWIAEAGQYHHDHSWVFTLGKANLIYRKSEQLFLLGGTTNQHDELAIDFKTLIEWHKNYAQELDFLPDFKKGKVDSGLRLRGPKRMPFYGLIPPAQNVYALTGLHKNGFSYPFYLADQCLDSMFDD